MVIILVGSALCTGSPTSAFPVLLLGRALQGVACAGLDVVTRVILADKVSLRESNENWTMFSFIDGIAFGVGPVIGGKSPSPPPLCSYIAIVVLVLT